jgi:hypothetical protein
VTNWARLDQGAYWTDLSAALEATEVLKGFSPNLSWSHYRSLSRLERPRRAPVLRDRGERCNWSQPVLERQIHSQLFARLLKSRDKAGMLQLARDGQMR